MTVWDTWSMACYFSCENCNNLIWSWYHIFMYHAVVCYTPHFLQYVLHQMITNRGYWLYGILFSKRCINTIFTVYAKVLWEFSELDRCSWTNSSRWNMSCNLYRAFSTWYKAIWDAIHGSMLDSKCIKVTKQW